MPRADNRRPDELRPIVIKRSFTRYAEGSVLIECGHTQVLCNASIEEQVPKWMANSGRGWVTAEYAMLPRATNTRTSRERPNVSGRSQEIQRLIARSLRAAVRLEALGPRTITLDCDVLQADGGTRTAAITGAMVALQDAVSWLLARGLLTTSPIQREVAAVSVGIVDGEPMLDLCYEEDSRAEVDFNVVMLAGGDLVEVQGTAEKGAFSRAMMNRMLDLAEGGITRLWELQRASLTA